MQRLAQHLSDGMKAHADLTMLVNGRGNRFLPLFYPYALASALYTARRKAVDVIHLADAMLAPIGVVLRTLLGKPVTATVHGLDITYSNRAYQSVV